ncbi:carboxymuconolactone decarboxylase family protein [Inquilinus sp. OTU3971]|uniref:carboxymuconolactone decarboxylase family protein n=1 Tax=Inquilinus sp. OTU3971 TaxID=3043855 RepID=UPI00313D8DC1
MLERHRERVRARIVELQACLLVLDAKIGGYADMEKRIKGYDATRPKRWRMPAGTRQAGIDGEAGHNVVAALADIAPDFATYLFEFPFGDIYSRAGLDLRSREIATIAALIAMGNAAPQLRVHIEAGLNVGLSREEFIEVIMQMAVSAGFSAALNGLFAVKEVFAQRASPTRDAPA